MFELFEAVEVMLGNDPAAENVRQLLAGIKELELIDILTMLQFDTKVQSLSLPVRGNVNFRFRFYRSQRCSKIGKRWKHICKKILDLQNRKRPPSVLLSLIYRK